MFADFDLVALLTKSCFPIFDLSNEKGWKIWTSEKGLMPMSKNHKKVKTKLILEDCYLKIHN